MVCAEDLYRLENLCKAMFFFSIAHYMFDVLSEKEWAYGTPDIFMMFELSMES